MNHRHRKVLEALFAHPVSGNIHAGDVEALLTDLGAELEHTHHGKLMVRLGGQAQAFPHMAHTLSPDQVRLVRKFLESAGVRPDAPAA
ncbi:hypothetical protein [Benzoatithermus flavus]|uniref:HicA toxin of toxin-antitoxin n=1 Tax=Benzoatithermus flavus TaxID=3108223 RepID=A0ABU8XMA0_9PROT